MQSFVDSQGWKATVEELPHVGFYKVCYEGGVLAQRKDIAAFGGKKLKWGKMDACIFDKEGKALYEGIPFCYSGYIHRAVLVQNAAQLDVETWHMNPAAEKLIADFGKKAENMKYDTKEKKQKAICEYLTEQGYRLYWDPSVKE